MQDEASSNEQPVESLDEVMNGSVLAEQEIVIPPALPDTRVIEISEPLLADEVVSDTENTEAAAEPVTDEVVAVIEDAPVAERQEEAVVAVESMEMIQDAPIEVTQEDAVAAVEAPEVIDEVPVEVKQETEIVKSELSDTQSVDEVQASELIEIPKDVEAVKPPSTEVQEDVVNNLPEETEPVIADDFVEAKVIEEIIEVEASSAAVPLPPDTQSFRTEPSNTIQIWQAKRGKSLEYVLTQWCADENVVLDWKLSENYKLDKDVFISGTFKNALDVLFTKAVQNAPHYTVSEAPSYALHVGD